MKSNEKVFFEFFSTLFDQNPPKNPKNPGPKNPGIPPKPNLNYVAEACLVFHRTATKPSLIFIEHLCHVFLLLHAILNLTLVAALLELSVTFLVVNILCHRYLSFSF